jgi:hypothetical protein
VLVEGLDLVHHLEHGLVAVALDGEKALVGVLDVLGGQLPAVDRRLVVPANSLPEREDVGGLGGLGPRFGQIGSRGYVPGLTDGPAFTSTSRLWENDRSVIVAKEIV